jgi:tetratricopeptide (TPR) repeat protein
MSSPHITYNPGILGDEELARSFVVRQQSLELILETLRENAASVAANRHLIMIGPRGIGKTMLVRRAAAAARSNPEYSSKWYPLVFGEESYPVSTPGEFWLEALFHLGDQTGELSFQKTLEELRDERNDARLRDRSLAQLLDFADQQGKRVLLVVENLNTLIGQQMTADAAWDLRHTLLNEPRLMLLGTATNRFDEVENIGHAWFEMFSVHQLQPLTIDECGDLWRAVTGESLASSPLKAVRILTGGNPRLLKILAGFAANHSFRQLMEQLVHLIDDHTEYFKGHLDSLAVKERRVFVALLERWDPVSAADLARQTRLSVNEVSSLLGRLSARGAVEVAPQKARRRLYQASERLYNIYYLMRRRGHPEGRVQAAVQFMVTFYENEELVTRLADLAREACTLPEDIRKDHYCAYREVLRKVQRITPQVVDCTLPEFFQTAEARLTREMGTSGVNEKAHSLYHEGNLQESERLYRLALRLDENNAQAWSGLGGVLYADAARSIEAEQAARRANDLDPSHGSWHNLGMVLGRLGRWQEAEEALLRAVGLDSKYADTWDRLGQARYMLKRLPEAEEASRMATKLAPKECVYWNNFARPLWSQGRLSEAEHALRKAIDLDSTNRAPWQGLGHLLLETGPPEEAEKVWAEALRLHGDEISSCAVHLLELWLARGVDHDVILEEANAWLERSKRNPNVLAVMAKFVASSRITKGLLLAEAWAREAFAKLRDADTAEALSLVLAGMEEWEEALESSKAMLDSAASDEQARQISTEFLIRAAAAGWAKKALEVLQRSKAVGAMEPLSIGFQIFLGEEPVVAKEIAEIGNDVAERIRKYRSEVTQIPNRRPNS